MITKPFQQICDEFNQTLAEVAMVQPKIRYSCENGEARLSNGRVAVHCLVGQDALTGIVLAINFYHPSSSIISDDLEDVVSFGKRTYQWQDAGSWLDLDDKAVYTSEEIVKHIIGQLNPPTREQSG
jgi:hypothetical protein